MILGGRLSVLVDHWDQHHFTVVASAEILSEYATVMARPKFGLPRDVVDSIIAYIERQSELVTPLEKITVIEDDSADNMFLECAVAGQADLIVSGDPHLNTLKQFRNIKIITPYDFLTLLGSQF
jgi:putative PIN family toxin of toxin-antitoxin system